MIVYGMGGGAVTFPLLAPNGSVAAPSYAFASSPSSGLYSGGANIVDVSAGGTGYLRIAPGYAGVRSELRVGAFAGDNTNFTLDLPSTVIARMQGGHVYCLALMNDGAGNPLTVLSLDCGFGWNSNNFLTSNTTMDLVLRRDASDVLAQRRGTNAQTVRIYNTYTDASNYERFSVGFDGSGGVQIRQEFAGTGAVKPLYFGNGALGNVWQVPSTAGHILAVTDNTYDIGASGATRPRTLYLGTSCIVQSDTGLVVFGASSDAAFGRLAAASVRQGLAPSATPVAQTFTIGEASRPGTDSDVGGADGTIRSGLGTGTGTSSTINFQTPTLAASGSGAQTYATRFTVATNCVAPTVPVYGIAGSAGGPSYAFGVDTAMGMYRVASAQLGFSVNSTLICQALQLAGLSTFSITSDTGLLALGANFDAYLGRTAAAALRVGGAPSATPTAQTFTVGESSRGTTDMNVAGADGTIRSGQGTGNSAGASLFFQTPTPTASGNVAQAYATRLTLSVLGAVFDIVDQGLRINNQVNGAGASSGTLTNAPAAGNPTFWLPINVGGTVRYCPLW